jgi:CRP/FNR family cyclic AMP-dependent transcriptional regulator
MAVGERSGHSTPDFLSALSPEDAEAFRVHGTVRRYSAGAVLFHEAQVPDRVVVLLKGRVKVSCVDEEGKEIVLAIRGAGDLVGELSAIDGNPRSATATAIDEVAALVLPASDFKSFVRQRPEAALSIVQVLSSRLRDADRKRVEFAVLDSVGRVAARILELCERFGEPTERGVSVDLPMSQEELGGWTGCSREAASKALQTMRALGWLETRRRSIVVLDLEALRKRSSPGG